MKRSSTRALRSKLRQATGPRRNHTLAAVVTGGANGIGEAIAKHLSLAGHPVAVIDRDERGCARIERWARERRRPLLAVHFDITDIGQHRRVAKRIRKTLGIPVGVLVNAAGMGVSHSFRRTTTEDLDTVWATNLRGPFFFTQAMLRIMPNGGSIVFITSVHQDQPVGDPTYSMSKAALKVLVKELALELGPKRRIRVNGIAPGAIRHRKTVEPRFSRVPLGQRRGTPEEVARVAAFLVSPDASYITGELITVDAGLSLVNWISTEGMQP